MSELYRSEYAVHIFDEENKILYSDWLPTTENMTEEDFFQEMKEWLRVSLEAKFEYLYDNCVNFLFPISPKNQIWMAKLLNEPWVKIGLKKYAHIMPDELISGLSVEQMFEEFFNMNLENQFEIQHFPDGESANEWLLGGRKANANIQLDNLEPL
jgi:hypothetical protein